jgi:hypothetical protein
MVQDMPITVGRNSTHMRLSTLNHQNTRMSTITGVLEPEAIGVGNGLQEISHPQTLTMSLNSKYPSAFWK